jgi:predicted hotdog family 3-hydroxylacyl-ACP dehydratase
MRLLEWYRLVLMAYAIDVWAGLLGVKEGFMVGKLKLGPSISRLKAGQHGVVGSGGSAAELGGAGGGRVGR